MKFHDLKFLSKEYAISIFTFRKFIKMGLPHYRLGRKNLINPIEFEDWFEKFKVVSNANYGSLDKLVENAIAQVKQNSS